MTSPRPTSATPEKPAACASSHWLKSLGCAGDSLRARALFEVPTARAETSWASVDAPMAASSAQMGRPNAILTMTSMLTRQAGVPLLYTLTSTIRLTRRFCTTLYKPERRHLRARRLGAYDDVSRVTMPRTMKAAAANLGRTPHPDVYVRLRSLIVTGRIAPGTRLVEAEFAQRMAVSRTPVREAIRRLAHEGLAQVVRAGAKLQVAVAPATVADLIDLFAIIGALESVAGRGVDRLGTAERASLARDLTALNARFAKLAQNHRRHPERFFDSHDAFHSTFVERCASERLQHLIGAVRPQVKRYELLYATAVGKDFSASLREHRSIISALRSGNADHVERAIRLNWTNSAARLSAGLASAAVGALGSYRDGDMGDPG